MAMETMNIPWRANDWEVQALITACVDTGVRQGLLQMHENEGSWGAQARLLELGDAEHRPHMDVAPQPASWFRAGARGVR